MIGVVPMGCGSFAAAESLWQYGRIANVKKSNVRPEKSSLATDKTGPWRTQYTITVHVQDRMIIGHYFVSATKSEPPLEWDPGYAVPVAVSENTLYLLQSQTASLRLDIARQKHAKPMQPFTAEEKKRLDALVAEPQSMIGFSKAADEQAAAAEPAPAPPPAPTTGSVTVSSTPYLSEVFVDGKSMGYTPAKIELAPGKHSIRVEKPGYWSWAKEMTIAVGSELTLDATLAEK